jgi:hypothetical protein
LDRGLGYLLEKIYYAQARGDYFQTTYAVQKANEKVLIFGSSRALHHYVSDVFEKKLNLTTYNIGRNGKNILYSYALLSQILTHHKPEIIILDVQQKELSWKSGKDGEDEMISSLLPYAQHAPVIANSISAIRKEDIILSTLFKTYPYNSNVAQILGYHYGFMSELKNVKGYAPLNGNKVKMEENNNSEKAKEEVIDKKLMEAFDNFLSLAKKNRSKVYIIVSPTSTNSYETSVKSIPKMKIIAQKYGFNLYDFSRSKEFEDYKLFYDYTHLNNEGAVKFSNLVLDKVIEHPAVLVNHLSPTLINIDKNNTQ